MPGPVLLVFTADWHTNSTVGLNPPVFYRELGSQHIAGKASRTVWRTWLAFWKIIAAKKAELGATCYAFANGDLGDINKHSKTQLISNDESEIQDAMSTVADVMAQVADHIFVIRGTEAHTGGNGRLEEWLADDLDNAEKSTHSASWWVVDADIEGVRFQVTHHAPTSSFRPWTLDQAASRAASIVAARHFDGGMVKLMPNICVWAHSHTRGAQAKGMGGVWGFFLPPWQFRTSFAYRIGAGAGKIGGLWMVAQAGEITSWGWERWQAKRDPIWSTP